MNASANRVFISYRRDDAAGYAGRLEEALEQRLGRGSVFRDVLDIAPGEDFVAAIRARLAGAHTVLVLIGPRWAGDGAAGARRIDQPDDFVRLEVSMALDSGVRVVPVLLPGASMPAEGDLPAPLKPLARRNALSLGEATWDAEVARLAALIGLPQPKPRRVLLGVGVGLAVAAAAGLGGWWLSRPADAAERLVGTWAAELRYGWGDRYTETFEFKRHAGALTGTASFLKYPRAIENLQLDGPDLHHLGALVGHLQHLLVGDDGELAGLGHHARIGRVDALHVGVDLVPVDPVAIRVALGLLRRTGAAAGARPRRRPEVVEVGDPLDEALDGGAGIEQ